MTHQAPSVLSHVRLLELQLLLPFSVHILRTCLPLQSALLDRTVTVLAIPLAQGGLQHSSVIHAWQANSNPLSCAGVTRMRNIFWIGVFASDGGDADVRGFAGFGESVVAGIKVFALLNGY
jgi:hypothetical protein